MSQVFKKRIHGTDYVATLAIDDTSSCSVCFQPFTTQGKIITGCGHRYCLKCFICWLLHEVGNGRSIKCMLCRQDLSSDLPQADVDNVRIHDIHKIIGIVNVRMTIDEFNNFKSWREIPTTPVLLRQIGIFPDEDVSWYESN
jgi:hypothetical protein